MLKSIEISGFKSFADRTRIEFAEGISAIVGPNGSGKSNIVDAIKWVLGEQSVKKLRGNEMTDVIFNGSASRSGVNTAEVTLSFDNSNRYFSVDSNEVHITRRVYRNGDSEYLINRQASRLRDVREILSGTGLGSQAYSIIEQGRVESLLQSSPIQRREIIEEAAGIARFNAKKQEVQRRLERVEQNLLRLSDIVSEVENQLRNTKSQAGKALLYRQYTTRLQELRTQVCLVEWREKSEKREFLQKELTQYREVESELEVRVKNGESDFQAINAKLESLNQETRQIEHQVATLREKIAAEESAVEFQSDQMNELEQEIFQHGRQLCDFNVRNGDTEEQMRQADDELFQAKRNLKKITQAHEAGSLELTRLNEQCNSLMELKDQIRKFLQELNLDGSRLVGEISGFHSRIRTLENTKAQRTEKRDSLRRQIDEIASQFGELKGTGKELTDRIESCKQRVAQCQQQQEEHSGELARNREELLDLKQRESGISERISLLKDLLRKHDGLSPGVQEVLQESKNPKSPFRHVHGLVADLIRVNVEAATLIELALGPTTQYIVVSPEAELFRYIEENSRKFAGRVGFIWLDPHPNEAVWDRNNQFDQRPGVLGRADQFVETEPLFVPLVKRLLSRVWIVENIAVAKSLYRESDGRTSFLTVSGECLASDGTLVVGPPFGASGLITRRSELRTLFDQFSTLEGELKKKEQQVELLESQLQNDNRDTETANQEYQRNLQKQESLRLQQTATERRDQQTQADYQQLEQEINDIVAELEKIKAEKSQAEERKAALDAKISEQEKLLADTQAEYEKMTLISQQQLQKTTELKIAMTTSETTIDLLNQRKNQFEESRKERRQLQVEHHQRLISLKARRDQAELVILNNESNLADFYAKKERISDRLRIGQHEQRHLGVQRGKLQQELKKINQALNKNRDAIHSREIAVERLVQEQKTLVDRMKEDYGIDLSDELVRRRYEEGGQIRQETSNQPEDRNPLSEPVQDCPDPEENSSGSVSDSAGTLNPAENGKQPGRQVSVPENGTQNVSEENAGNHSLFDSLEDAQKEIEDLRGKLQSLGSVNLEAIETLESLETRYTTLFNQYNDLVSARKSIQKIIERINADSLRLFEETFDSIKIYFCDIFRKLFGGGHANLILEDENHPLESGIEIAVKPPGKELKNIALMSGGEKTLTCIALLLAIFQYRINPVCILDEVDAALDEGNVGRFLKVIQSFENQTQFLVITHSKKTMSAARVMYGVTMQDSGVSKLLAVQFDEVGENGEILVKQNKAAADTGSEENESLPKQEFIA